MKKVSILVLESSVMQAIADPQYLFSTVNRFLEAAGKAALFDVELVGLKRSVKLNNGSFTVHIDRRIQDVIKTDLVLIPALSGDLVNAIDQNKKFIPWIKEQHAKGADVASLCLGAFMLAATGLLNGKRCSTHWGFANEFSELFPGVAVEEGNIVTEEKRIYSSGGALSYWNLLLHLVEKYSSREMAILAAKYFAVDIDRSSQASFAMFKGQKNHNDDGIRLAQDFIETHLDDRISIDELSSLTLMSRRSFERRFRQVTNNSVLEYIQRVKIEAAKRQLENSRKNISEVMYEVGYSDSKAFRDLFKKLSGLTPVEYRNKYNKVPMVA